MPLYSYQCTNCGYVFEKLLSISRKDEPKEQPCPNCEENTVQEHIQCSGAIQFNDAKGSSHFKDVLKHIHDSSKVPELQKR